MSKIWISGLFLILIFLLQMNTFTTSSNHNNNNNEEEDSSLHGKDPRQYNFAALTSGAEVIDYSPKNGKGFKHLLSDDRDKYTLFNCNEKKWVIIGLSQDVLIESIVIASYEKYSSIVKDFQVLAAVSFPQSNWIDLGNYSVLPKLGDQVFEIKNPSNFHTRFVKIRFFTQNFNEDLCTISQIKVFGKTIYETIKTGVETMFTEDAAKGLEEHEKSGIEQNDTIEVGTSSTIQENTINPIEGGEVKSPEINVPAAVSASTTSTDPIEESPPREIEEIAPAEITTDEELPPQPTMSDQTTSLNEDSVFIASTTISENKDPLIGVPQINEEDQIEQTDLGEASSGTRPNESSEVAPSESDKDTSFNDVEWKLINDTLINSGGSEAFIQTAIRRITEIFMHRLNPFGRQLNQINLDSFLSDMKKDEVKVNDQVVSMIDPPSSSTVNNDRTSDGIVSPETLQKQQVAETVKISEPEEVIETKDDAVQQSTTPSESLSNNDSIPAAEIKLEPAISNDVVEASTAVNAAEDSSSTAPNVTNKETIPTESINNNNNNTPLNIPQEQIEVSPPASISIVSSGTILPVTVSSNQTIDCLSILKFAEFRKKRLKDEKENNNNDDKANVFNKLFIRIKSIETNEEIIGFFFDEVVKCFQNETQSLKVKIDKMKKEIHQLQDKFQEVNQYIDEQKKRDQLQEEKRIEKEKKWQEFLVSSSSNEGEPAIISSSSLPSSSPSSPNQLSLSQVPLDHKGEHYFHKLFHTTTSNNNNNNTSNLPSRSSHQPSTTSSSSSSSFQINFANNLKHLLFQTFQQFRISLNPEEDSIYESLSTIWSQFYTWSHFHTSDMMFILVLLMGCLIVMMTCFFSFMILWLLLQRK